MSTEIAEIVRWEQLPDQLARPNSRMANPARVYLSSIGNLNSRRTMKAALEAIASVSGRIDHGEPFDLDSMPWEAIRNEHALAIRAALILEKVPKYRNGEWKPEERSATSINKMMAALRQVIRTAWRLGYFDAETRERTLDFKTLKAKGLRANEAGKSLSDSDLRALIEAAQDDHPKVAIRNTALLSIHYGAGMRRAEVCSLTMLSYDDGRLTIRGKGNKTRKVPLPSGARSALEDWLEIRGKEQGPMFCPIKKNDTMLIGRGLSAKALDKIYKKLADKAGIEFKTHDLRRTFAGNLMDAGVDMRTVQGMMGHADINTTTGYDRRDSKARDRAAEKLYVPYKRKERTDRDSDRRTAK